MLFHRFGTFAHILASTTIDWFGKKVRKTLSSPDSFNFSIITRFLIEFQTKDLSEDALLSKHAVDIVRDLQRLDGIEGDYDEGSGSGPGRRKTIRNLEKSRKKTQAINTLDVAFRQRFFNLQAEGQLGN